MTSQKRVSHRTCFLFNIFIFTVASKVTLVVLKQVCREGRKVSKTCHYPLSFFFLLTCGLKITPGKVKVWSRDVGLKNFQESERNVLLMILFWSVKKKLLHSKLGQARQLPCHSFFGLFFSCIYLRRFIGCVKSGKKIYID